MCTWWWVRYHFKQYEEEKMKKWGTKSDIGGIIIFTALVADAFFELNPYLLFVCAIIGLILVFSSIYDEYKNKKSK